MSAAPVSRALVLRQSKQVLRRPQFRNASTTSEVASKAKDTASSTVSKASEGLSKVQTSAGSTVSGIASSAQNTLSSIGGRTGRVIKFVESLIPPTIYYGRVGLELGKMMVQGQKMAPPSTSQISSYFQPVMNVIRNPRSITSAAESASNAAGSAASNATPEAAMSSIRSISGEQVSGIAIAAAQILGFFTVGTMIGRLKLIGYHGEVHHEEH